MTFQPLQQADFLAILDRILPPSYLDPLKNTGGPGYEILQAAAAAAARASAAVAVLDQQGLIGTATGGSLATATVTFSRPTSAAGALTIRAGTVVRASATGRDFVLLADLPVGGSSLSAGPATVQAVAQSYEFNNCRGPRTAADGAVIPGDIDAIRALITVPDYADPTITVAQATDASGGASADLDQLGADLNLPRHPGEADVPYRARLRQLPDTVSPGAIRRLVASVFQPFAAAGYGTTYFLETWQLAFCTAFDVPNLAGLPGSSPLHAADLNSCFFYDDTRGPGGPNVPNPSGYFGRWMDINDYRGAFVVVVPNLPAMLDRGMFYDDPAAATSGPFNAWVEFATPIGSRGTSAYDAAGLNPLATQGFYDGLDLPKAAVYAGLFSLLNSTKAGGVTAEVVLFGLS